MSDAGDQYDEDLVWASRTDSRGHSTLQEQLIQFDWDEERQPSTYASTVSCSSLRRQSFAIHSCSRWRIRPTAKRSSAGSPLVGPVTARFFRLCICG